ncbi:ribbon-helix-helix protein, CopG family [Rahnella sp. PCH160]|uniref:ribbon-helix-helix protein, CopG family n=1 Tax=Rahnella sp. PCH160 TaxID=3447928 RepID=UPI0039FCD2E8
MALKKTPFSNRRVVTEAEADALANRLADRPYGDEKVFTEPAQEILTRTTISLPQNTLREIEDLALHNKRSGISPKSVSAIIRDALDTYLKKV